MRNSTLVLSQLDVASETLMALRWAIDRALEHDDLPAFAAIVRLVLPAARAALGSAQPSSADAQVRIAAEALIALDWAVSRAAMEPDFDGVIAAADPLIERCQIAVDAAQDLLRKKTRRTSRSTSGFSRSRITEDSSQGVV